MAKGLAAKKDPHSILGREDPPEGKMATHSGILAWEIPWTEEPGGVTKGRCNLATQQQRQQWRGRESDKEEKHLGGRILHGRLSLCFCCLGDLNAELSAIRFHADK